MASESPDTVWGTWYPPHSSRAVKAAMTIGADGFAVIDGADGAQRLARGDIAVLDVSARVGAIPRRIAFSDRSVFETADNDGVDRLLAARIGRRGRFVSELERFRPRLLVFALVIVALSVGVYRYAVPALVEVAVAVTPPVVPQLMSQSVMVSLDRSVFAESRLPMERRTGLTVAFRDLARHASGGTDAFSLNFRDGGAVGPNAFALPDGTIVVTDQLVEMAKGDDEAVLAVLGHEIGHVVHDHSLRRLYRAAGVAGLIMLIGGDIGSGAEDLLVQGSALVSLSYSRDDERAADRYSVEIMARAGRDPAAIVRFFDMLKAIVGEDGAASFLSSHPATAERIAETQRYAAEVEAAGAAGGAGSDAAD